MPIIAPIPRGERRLMQKAIHKTRDKNHARRLTAMLMLHRGERVSDVARTLCCARSSVGRWINWFTHSGIEGLKSLPAGRSRRWPFEHICTLLRELIKHSPGDFGYQRSRWSTELLAIKINEITGCQLHAGTVRRWLPSAGLVWRRAAPTLRIRDPHKDEKMAVIHKALDECSAEHPVFYEDEVDIHLNPKIGADWQLRGQQKRVVTPGQNEKYYPQYVKPFVRGQKNDGNDAQAIAVALMQPTMQFVPPKSPEQQDIQALHRARQRIVNHRTATVCQIRGLLLDRGIPIGSAVSRVRRAIPLILEDAENGLSSRMRRTIAELYELFNDLGRRIHFFDKEIETVFRQSEACQRIARVKGIGPKTATAVVAAIGKGTEFKNGRHFAAWLGLVPRQHSSGDRQVLMNMTKKGDKHLRTLFIHGARAVVRVATNNNDGHMNQWVNQLKERRGFNKTTVAVANKNARIIWSMLRNETEYQVE